MEFPIHTVYIHVAMQIYFLTLWWWHVALRSPLLLMGCRLVANIAGQHLLRSPCAHTVRHLGDMLQRLLTVFAIHQLQTGEEKIDVNRLTCYRGNLVYPYTKFIYVDKGNLEHPSSVSLLCTCGRFIMHCTSTFLCYSGNLEMGYTVVVFVDCN